MPDLLSRLRRTNQVLDRFFVSTAFGKPTGSLVSRDGLAAVLSEILSVREMLLRNERSPGNLELTAELGKYRSHLEHLRILMPSLQAELLTERARLEAERSHLEAASGWSAAYKDATPFHFK